MNFLFLLLLFFLNAEAFDHTVPFHFKNSPEIQVFATVENLAHQKVKVILPGTKLIHASGDVEFADEMGVLKLHHPIEEYSISLSSQYFYMLKGGVELKQKILSDDGDLNLNQYFSIVHITARVNLELARHFALLIKIQDMDKSWFLSPVNVELDFDEGCNAGWDGQSIMINVGDATCLPPGLSADVLIHEYGHGILTNLVRKQPIPSDFSEAFADSFMSMLTRNAEFAEGFYPKRAITYIRSLAPDYKWPEDSRGQYASSLIFSSTLWDAKSIIERHLGEKAYLLCLGALFKVGRGVVAGTEISVHLNTLLTSLLSIPEVRAQKTLVCELMTLFTQRGGPEHKGCFDSPLKAIKTKVPRKTLSLERGEIRDMGKLIRKFKVELRDISQVTLELDVEHSFSQDLLIYFELPNGRIIPVYKGFEELLVPKTIGLPAFPKGIKGNLKLIFEDIGTNFSGLLKSGKIIFY